MTEYTVSWACEIDADDPQQAAEKALEMIQQADTWGHVFTVRKYGDTGIDMIIDLDQDRL